MAYISKEDVKAIREELKASELKFGVKKMHGGLENGVDVTIKSGKVDFTDCFTHGDGYAQINQYSHICMVIIKQCLMQSRLLKLLLLKEKVIGRTKAGMTILIP